MDEQGTPTHDAERGRGRRALWIAATPVAALLAVGGIVWAVAGPNAAPSATPTSTGTSVPAPTTTLAADPTDTATTTGTPEPDATTGTDGTPSPTPGDDASIPDPTDPPKALLSERVTDVLERAAEVLTTLDPTKEPDDTDLEQVAGGAYLAAVRAAAAEYTDLGWRQTGTPRVDSLEIVEEDLTGTPPTVVAEVCIDSSEVDVLDEGGSLRGAGTPDRSLNLLTFELTDGTWRVVTQSFPADPDC